MRIDFLAMVRGWCRLNISATNSVLDKLVLSVVIELNIKYLNSD